MAHSLLLHRLHRQCPAHAATGAQQPPAPLPCLPLPPCSSIWHKHVPQSARSVYIYSVCYCHTQMASLTLCAHFVPSNVIACVPLLVQHQKLVEILSYAYTTTVSLSMSRISVLLLLLLAGVQCGINASHLGYGVTISLSLSLS